MLGAFNRENMVIKHDVVYLVFQVEQDNSVNDANPHIANIGRMVEVNTVTLITLYCYCLIFYQIVIYIHSFLVFACLF